MNEANLDANPRIIVVQKLYGYFLNKETEIIFSSLKNLSDDGIALFIVSPSFLFKSKGRNVFEFIKEIGFSFFSEVFQVDF